MSMPIDIAPGFRPQQQTEFPLAVAVCAWCKPKPGSFAVAVVSHGICPRHMRNMRAKLNRKAKSGR